MVKKGLTKRQSEILHFIKGYISKNGLAPSIVEICSEFGLRSTNGVHQHLSAIEKKGYIKRSKKGRSRDIHVAQSEEHIEQDNSDNSINIIGNGTALSPMSVFINSKGKISVDRQFFDLSDDSFAANVSDEGLSKMGINSGDLLILKPQKFYESDEVVHVIINDIQITRIYKDFENHFILESTNRGFPKMKFNYDDKSCHILGEVVGLLRKF